MQKLKNLSLNILRIFVLYYLNGGLLSFGIILYLILGFCFTPIFWLIKGSAIEFTCFIALIMTRGICYFLKFFIAKKLGLIKILDSLPFFKAIIFILFVEIVLSLSFPINFNDLPFFEFVIKSYKLIISNTLMEIKVGSGWIYPIIVYKTIKLLTTKYPNKFNWILKLYPKKLDEIITFNNFKKIIYKLIINPTKKAIKWLKDNYRPY